VHGEAQNSPVPRGRLAPSPTGVLHLGNARTFLLAWLDLRSRGGELLLRVEDLDGPRVRKEAVQATLEDLRWLGLDWDGPVVLQSHRLDRHRAALERLQEAGLVYPCTCSRRDIERAASAPHAGEEGPVYPGTCRGRWQDAAEAEAATGRRPAWRFRVPEGQRIGIEDRFAGHRSFPSEGLGDFVVWKRDGTPAYQLAVVVDDAEQGVDEILRGEDLLPSAARQRLLQEALDLPLPRQAHVPLVVGEDGRRLAKRHGDTSLAGLRRQGVEPAEVRALLARWSGLDEEAARAGPAALLEGFALERVPREPAVWRPGLLDPG